jgi:hypothetical protein
MKTTIFTVSFAVLLLAISTITVAQTQLNQVELLKQFYGTWKCESGRDTIVYWDAKPFGNGFNVDYKIITKGILLSEAKQLFGYDRKADKCIGAGMVKGMDIEIWALWFTSGKNFIIMPYSDLPAPEKVIMKVIGEFKSPDIYTETVIVNNSPVKTYSYMLMK